MTESLVVVIVEELMFQTRIESALVQGGQKVHLLENLNDGIGAVPNAAAVKLWIMDMGVKGSWPEWVREIKTSFPTTQVIAFGSHVDVEAFERARQAGADQTLARSRFFQLLPSIALVGTLREGP